MSYTLYEVWSEDELGHQDLVETTASETEAINIAERVVLEGSYASVVYKETEDGDLIEVERFESD